MPDRIILVGPYSVGKTTLGAQLAEELGWEFVDSDALLRRPPREVALELGEEGFRKVEEAHLLPQLARSKVVIATGGGAVESVAIRHQLASTRLVIHLQLDSETLWQRWLVRGLPTTAPSRAHFEAYLKRRIPLYEEVADGACCAEDWEALRAFCGQ
ncbi:MAG: shikimate kinase [Parachlamydiales bacterium]